MMADGSNLVDGGHLRAFIERIEKLEEEKRALADDVRDVYAELKGVGFDPKIVRKIVSMRKQDKSKREEEEAILDLYLNALGMLSDTPLGRAAVERDFGRASDGVLKALKAMGDPVPVSEEDKAKGYVASFKGKDGTVCSIGLPKDARA